jgi:adenosylcobinamide kinase / adenosylcobinamide-phosphate guanylyltransferase
VSKVTRKSGNLPVRMLQGSSEGEAPRPELRQLNSDPVSHLRRRGFFMAGTVFITGGARSGKSRLAEELALKHGAPLVYIATGAAGDGDMAERIDRHRARRGPDWLTVEEPLDLAGAISAAEGECTAMLVDCITLWLTNLLLKYDDASTVLKEVERLVRLLPTLKTPLLLVSNEVGLGIVPENRLARTFRDLAGEANELLAGASQEVYVMFSGLPLKLKG